MGNVYDIKSANVVIGSQAGTTSFGIGRVPDGATRFITYIAANNLHLGAGATNTLYLASNAASTVTTLATATGNKKLTVPFVIAEPDQSKQVPEGGQNMDNPLFTIAASHFLVGCASRGSVNVFVKYFDN